MGNWKWLLRAEILPSRKGNGTFIRVTVSGDFAGRDGGAPAVEIEFKKLGAVWVKTNTSHLILSAQASIKVEAIFPQTVAEMEALRDAAIAEGRKWRIDEYNGKYAIIRDALRAASGPARETNPGTEYIGQRPVVYGTIIFDDRNVKKWPGIKCLYYTHEEWVKFAAQVCDGLGRSEEFQNLVASMKEIVKV